MSLDLGFADSMAIGKWPVFAVGFVRTSRRLKSAVAVTGMRIKTDTLQIAQ